MCCFALIPAMDFVVRRFYACATIIWCLFLVSFPFPIHAQAHQMEVQRKIFKNDDANSTLIASDHLPKEFRRIVWICAHSHRNIKKAIKLDISNETNLSNEWIEELCSYKKIMSFNLTFQCGIICSCENSKNVCLYDVLFKDSNSCFVILSNFTCDHKLFSLFYSNIFKRGENLCLHSKTKSLKFLQDLVLSYYTKHKPVNRSNKLHAAEFNEACQNLLMDKDEHHPNRAILRFCSQRNLAFERIFSNLRKLRKLTFLLKRKCQHNLSTSTLQGLKMHRSKRDIMHIGKELSPEIPLQYSKIKEIRPKRESHALDSALPRPQTIIKYERVGKVWIPKFNETAYRIFLAKEKLKQDLRIESEWAYLCLVFLSLLIAFSLWCLRGFHSRNKDKRLVSYSDRDHFLTVKEVLYRKACYLPMFNREGPLEEVFVHDCGTNTDSCRLDMIRCDSRFHSTTICRS